MLKPKYFYICTICMVVIFFMWPKFDNDEERSLLPALELSSLEKSYKKLKYILMWSLPIRDPMTYLISGQQTFIKRRCPNTNCYATSNKQLLKDVSNFDAIIFHGPQIVDIKSEVPKSRVQRQKYIFASLESSDYYPVCHNELNGFFNWTWTYKLSSDYYYGYIEVRNKKGDIIGPRKEMHWKKLEEMAPVDEQFKTKLKNKTLTAAWFISNCKTPSKRFAFAMQVQSKLKEHGLSVDIYGSCGPFKCPHETMNDCLKIIERDYYFYFSFENSFSEDYVTEKLLHALQHNAIPVVYGAANYTRFMPDGIYLNALELGVNKLVREMIEIMNDKERYYNFFKWRNHYSYNYVGLVPESDNYCKLCEFLNNEEQFNKYSVIDNFKEWWNPPHKC